MKKVFNIKSIIIVVVLLVIVVAVLTVWPRYMPWEVNREREKINEQLPIAEERWIDANIDNYNLDVSVGAAYCLGRNATLQVRDGEIVTVIENGDFVVEDFINHPCSYNDLLPSTMFEKLKQQVDGMYISASFNNEYGYVEEFHSRAVSRQSPHSFFIVEYSNFIFMEESE